MWPETGKFTLTLAPMEGVTDFPMREFYREFSPLDYRVTDFLRVSQDLLPSKVFFRHAPEIREDRKTRKTPIQIQVLGGDPYKVGETAKSAILQGADGVDLNFGCPAPTVNRNDGGATLLKFPDRLKAIVRAAREAVPQVGSLASPVSAKLRLGWDNIRDIEVNARAAIEGGASWITIHGRTRMANYAPPAYWGPIGDVVKWSPVPVIANGEIWNRDDFLRCQEETRATGFMLGRGLLADPWLAHRIRGLEAPPRPFAPEVLGEVFLKYAKLCVADGLPPFRLIARLKQWSFFADKGGSIDWFNQIKRLTTLDEICPFLEWKENPCLGYSEASKSS